MFYTTGSYYDIHFFRCRPIMCFALGRGPASPLVHPPQLNKMSIIRKLRVSTLRY